MAGEYPRFPVAGDFDGDGVDTVGTYDVESGIFRLLRANEAGAAIDEIRFDPVLAFLIAGDFAGEGRDRVGVYD